MCVGVLLTLAFCSVTACQSDVSRTGHLADPFTAGWMLIDTDGDDIIDSIAGKLLVPAHPTAAENAAAANLAARIGFATHRLNTSTRDQRPGGSVGWTANLRRAGRSTFHRLGDCCGAGGGATSR